MQIFIVTNIGKTSDGPVMESQKPFLNKEAAEGEFLSLCKRGLLNEEDFTEEMGNELLDDGYYEDSFNYITISEEKVEE